MRDCIVNEFSQFTKMACFKRECVTQLKGIVAQFTGARGKY